VGVRCLASDIAMLSAGIAVQLNLGAGQAPVWRVHRHWTVVRLLAARWQLPLGRNIPGYPYSRL